MTTHTATTLYTRVAIIAFAVIALMTLGGARAQAQPKGDVSAGGTVLVLACQGAGGGAMVDEDRTGAGLGSVTVTGHGGQLDGLECTVYADHTDCHVNQVKSHVGGPKTSVGGTAVNGKAASTHKMNLDGLEALAEEAVNGQGTDLKDSTKADEESSSGLSPL